MRPLVQFGVETQQGKTYSGYLWNRSHLIAGSLSGYDVATGATPVEDLVTDTRMQNVRRNNGGMAYFETRTVSYFKAHPDVSVWHSATPVYVGALSSDRGLDMQEEVYDRANGYTIDYATGTFGEGCQEGTWPRGQLEPRGQEELPLRHGAQPVRDTEIKGFSMLSGSVGEAEATPVLASAETVTMGSMAFNCSSVNERHRFQE